MIIDVILACSLNFYEFDTLFKKVAYEVNTDYMFQFFFIYNKQKTAKKKCYNK